MTTLSLLQMTAQSFATNFFSLNLNLSFNLGPKQFSFCYPFDTRGSGYSCAVMVSSQIENKSVCLSRSTKKYHIRGKSGPYQLMLAIDLNDAMYNVRSSSKNSEWEVYIANNATLFLDLMSLGMQHSSLIWLRLNQPFVSIKNFISQLLMKIFCLKNNMLELS